MKVRNLLPVLMLATLGATAQPRVSPQVRTEREMQWLKDSLQLSADQVTKAATISRDFHTKMDATGPSKASSKKRQQIMSRKDADMKKLLSAKQYKTYLKHEKMMRAIEEQRRKHKGDMPL